jgi:hypothetical protein
MQDLDELFDYLIPRGTARFTLSDVVVRCDRPLVLVMKHAGEGNAEYKSLNTKLTKEFDDASKRGDTEAMHALNARLFASTVIVDWENCIGSDGQPIAYTAEIGTRYLTALSKVAPGDLGLAYLYARNPRNYRGSPAEVAATLGK